MPKGRRKGTMYGGKSATPVAIMRPSMRDLAWAAGFMEGEGHFRRTYNRTGGSCEVANAAQQSLEPLQRFAAMFGGTIRTYVHPDHASRVSQKPCSTWSVSGARARGVMMTLYPLMSERRKAQIRNAILPPTESGASDAQS